MLHVEVGFTPDKNKTKTLVKIWVKQWLVIDVQQQIALLLLIGFIYLFF